MKGFLKNGKWIGLLAIGLLFAGCYGGGDSSSDSAVTPVAHGGQGVPITVDPVNETLTIGGPEGAGIGITADGHSVQIINGATGCATVGGADEVDCYIRVINLDSDEYATNVRLVSSLCVGCISAQLDNVDSINGTAVGDCVAAMGAAPYPADQSDLGCNIGTSYDVANTFEICVTEDGDFRNFGPPYNPDGCQVVTTNAGLYAPVQVLHPECGSRAVKLGFVGQVPKYTFTGTVEADWYPADPRAGDVRYDFADRTTFYVMATRLISNGGVGDSPNGSAWLKSGSYQGSQIISGWGATGSNVLSGVTTDKGKYFAVNVALDYADRIEGQIMGDGSRNQNYEYYYNMSIVLRYNPTVVSLITANIASEGVGGDDAEDCIICQDAVNFIQADNGFTTILFGDNYFSGNPGWLSCYVDLTEGFKPMYSNNYVTWYGNSVGATIAYYATLTTGTAGTLQAYFAAPWIAGQVGVMRFNMTGGAMTYGRSGATALPSEGVDVAPDLPVSIHYFEVLPGSSGKGSQFWIDVFSSSTSLNIAWTNGTVYPGGHKGASDDWVTPCIPFSAGFEDNINQGCDVGLPSNTYDVALSSENTNLAISLSGRAAPGGDSNSNGGWQQQSAWICVQ